MFNILLPQFVQGQGAIGLLLFRLVLGIGFVLHGWPKLKHPTRWMEAEGTPPSIPAVQLIAAFTEFSSGLGFLLGLFTPLACLGMLGTMIGAVVKVHLPQGHPFIGPPGTNTAESCVNYAAAASVVLLLGPGQYSMDRIWMGIFFK
jgi:putative oxidoreductase